MAKSFSAPVGDARHITAGDVEVMELTPDDPTHFGFVRTKGASQPPWLAVREAVTGFRLREDAPPMRCSHSVLPPGLNFPRPRQCKCLAVCVEDGRPLCGQHNAEGVLRRGERKQLGAERRHQSLRLYLRAKVAHSRRAPKRTENP